MENVLDRGFNKSKSTEKKGRSRKKTWSTEEGIRRQSWRLSRGQIFQSFMDHRKNLRFDSEHNGKPFLISEKHPYLSCSCGPW